MLELETKKQKKKNKVRKKYTKIRVDFVSRSGYFCTLMRLKSGGAQGFRPLARDSYPGG